MSWSEKTEAPSEVQAEQTTATDSHSLANATPLVSVVIACYNSARYLSETLTYALKQTYPSVEVIVVDDGSSDSTAAIAQSYPVTYLRQANQGVSVARNAGMLHCRGEYIQFLDHDDRLLPEALETGVRLLQQHPEAAMAVGEHRYIANDGTTLGYSHKSTVGSNHYLELLIHNFIEAPCSVLHRRSQLPAADIFNTAVQGAEDYELYLRIARCNPLIVHKAVVAEYRLHDDSLSRNAERMIVVTDRVLQLERMHLGASRTKAHQLDMGCVFARRFYGRRLTRELIRSGWVKLPEAQRKRELLWQSYPLGFLAVALCRLLPARLLHQIYPSSL